VIVAIIITVALALFFTVPVASSSSPGGLCSPEGSCTPGYIHFTESLSCYFEGGGPHAWAGTYYFEGGLGITCEPVVA
jgi:hypothetical protein